MPKYTYTPSGLMNTATGEIEPFRREGPVYKPRIYTGDETEPLRSMADGQMYTSKAAMRESYRASNNPRGQEFVEVGDDAGYLNPVHKPLTVDKAAVAEAVIKAEAAVARGEFDHVE